MWNVRMLGAQESLVIEISECSLDAVVIQVRLPNEKAIAVSLFASCWCGGEQELVIK